MALRGLSRRAPQILGRRGRSSLSEVASKFPAPEVDPRLLENNLAWRKSKLSEDPLFFKNMANGQSPEYLWFGCSDSRVPANEIIGADCGAVFVHRNIANVITGNDLNAMSVLQYAVEHLKVKHIIVCGHYDCGGVRAACVNRPLDPPLDNWLRNIRDVRRLYRSELDLLTDPEDYHRRLVELNTIESCFNLFKTRSVQRQRLATHQRQRLAPAPASGSAFATPRIHAMVFDMSTGELKDLKIDWKSHLQDNAHIYQLYDKDLDKEDT